jgi:hypothetical protein
MLLDIRWLSFLLHRRSRTAAAHPLGASAA